MGAPFRHRPRIVGQLVPLLSPDATAARLRADLGSDNALLDANAILNAAECSSCVFRDSLTSTCRAWPPRPLADGRPVWPVVASDAWCGCWAGR